MFMVGFLSASYAIGQIYNDKSDLIKEPMEKFIDHARNLERNMSFNEAIERHFKAGQTPEPDKQVSNSDSM